MILVSPITEPEPIADQTLTKLVSDSNYTEFGKIDFPVKATLAECGAIDTAAVFIARPEDAVPEPTTAGLPVGIALYVQNPVTLTHELSILVRPDYVYTRLPLELLDSLVLDAAENGVKTLSTTDTNDDTHMRTIADKAGMSVRLDNNHFRQTRYTLQVDKHPGVVVF